MIHYYVDGVEMTRSEFRSRVPREGEIVVVQTDDFEPSIVDESKRADTDLNVLVKRWSRGESVPQFAPMQFGDVSEPVSFQEMQQRLITVERAFYSLPAEIRAVFGNSPPAFADALVDPERVEELRDLGILKAPEAQPPVGAAPPKVPEAPPEGAGPGGPTA